MKFNRRIWHFLLVSAILFTIWLLLSGKFDALHMGIGVAGALAIAAVCFPCREQPGFPVIRFLIYIPWALWQIFIANLHVARLVLLDFDQIRPQFVEQDPGPRDHRALTLLGCSITLTPGTLTVDVEEGRILVHALDDHSAKDLHAGVMARRVDRVFREDGRRS